MGELEPNKLQNGWDFILMFKSVFKGLVILNSSLNISLIWPVSFLIFYKMYMHMFATKKKLFSVFLC